MDEVIKRNPSKKKSEIQLLKDKHEREVAQLVEKNLRLERLVHGLDVDIKLSGLLPLMHKHLLRLSRSLDKRSDLHSEAL